MEYQYKAFISYKHGARDSLVAEELQNMLEEYIIPKDCRTGEQKTLGRIFRDEKDLPYTDDLPRQIKSALDASEFLIVICSPETSKSAYVPAEIAYFLENHSEKRIVPVLSFGDPKEVFGQVLPMLKEPFGMELSGFSDRHIRQGIRKLLSKLCAPLLGMEPDDLVRRELLWKQKRSTIRWSIALIVVMVIGCILWWSNRQIEGKNQELEQQNQELLLRESEILTQEALEAYQEGDRYGAIEKSLSALPAPGEDRPFHFPAAQVLFFAIDPFREENQNFVFRDTVLKQDTAVRDFCLNTDGKLLTTADKFNTLTCFDTVTGEKRWHTQICKEYAYEEPQVFYCSRWDCVLFFNKEVIAAVSQQTGELMWFMKPKYAANDMLLLREEDGIFAYVHQEMGDIEKNYTLMLCSAETGMEVQKIPIASAECELFEVGCYFPDTDSGKHCPGAFSPDGRYFAGSYITEDERIHYFLADTQTQTCTEICTGTAAYYDNVCMMAFGKEADSLLVIRRNPWKDGQLRIERIRLSDGAILWTQVVEGFGSDGVVCDRSNPLFFGVESVLYYLSFSDGEILHRMEMPDAIAALGIMKDGGFGYLLQNGQTNAGWINGTGFVTAQFFYQEHFDLGSCAKGQLWNGGSIRLLLEDDTVTGFTMRDEDDEGGYAAMIPQEDDHCVVIQRPVQLIGLQKPEYTASITCHSLLDHQLVGKDTLVLFNISGGDVGENQYRTIVLDPHTLTQKAVYTTEEYRMADAIAYLPDGSGYLKTGYSSITLFDLKNSTATELIEEFHLDSWLGDPSRNSDVLEVSNCRLSENGDVLSVAAAEHGIRIWRNGVHRKDAAYPRQLVGSDQWLNGITLHAEANGMVLVSSMSETGTRLFLVYDSNADRWYQIHTELPFEDGFALVCGKTAPVLLVLDSRGVAYLYDIPSQSLRHDFPTAAPLTALQNMQFCVNDANVLFYTKDRDVRIFDAASGQLVYEERLPWTSQGMLHCYEDPLRGYLYFASESANDSGYCLAADTWSVLTDIPNLMLCNEYTGRILQIKRYFGNDTMQLWLSSLMTTEELIAFGETIVEE